LWRSGSTPAISYRCGESELGQYLESVKLFETSDDDAAERAKMSIHLRSAFERGQRCYVLSRDERNHELLHEWGSVLFVFREFLFIGTERNCVERFIIGYD
jgi:hypothetical protein